MSPSTPREPFVLIVGREFDPHVDQMLVMLHQLGIGCLRWRIETFPRESGLTLETVGGDHAGCLRIDGREVDLRSVRSVWYRRMAPPDLPSHLTDEERRFAVGEARAALEGLARVCDWFWVNHPDKAKIAGSKMLQLKIAAELGFRIPRTLVTNEPEKVRDFFHANRGAVIYKPFNSGFFAGTQKVCYTTPLAAKDLDNLDLIRLTPGLFQENVAKKLEVRVTAIGRTVFATEIHSQAHAGAADDWRAVETSELLHRPHRLPAAIEGRCLAFLERFGLAYGAMDFIVTPAGEYVFLENNPAGQFGWLEDMTGEPMTATLARMLIAGTIV